MALDEKQISMLQELIDVEKPGEYDAMDLIPDEFREYFSSPTVHGTEFSLAVALKKFRGVEPLGMALGSKHMRYALHGYSPAKLPD